MGAPVALTGRQQVKRSSRAAKTAGLLRCCAAYLSRWEWTIAFRSKSAVSNRALIITKSKCRACATSMRALAMRRAITSAPSSPRRCSRCCSSSQLGGRMKISTAFGNSALICSAPCQSISSTTSCAAGDARLDRAARRAVAGCRAPRPIRRTRRARPWPGTSPRRRSGIRGPSCSWPRGLRVVCETETTRCESSSSSDLTRLDLPAPLGAATTKRLPG